MRRAQAVHRNVSAGVPALSDGNGAGPDPRHCGARKKPARGGGFCQKPAGWGTDHVGTGRCRFHGGATPSHNRKAQKDNAIAAVETYGLPRDVDPDAALLEELHRTAGHVAWLNGIVTEIDGDDLHGPVGGGPESIPREEPSIWLRLYQEERKHLAAVAKSCIDAGIEERKVQLAEQQGALLAQVLQGVLDELGVKDGPKRRKVVRKHLTLVVDNEEAA